MSNTSGILNTYWKNVASVLSGSAIAQAIPVIGSLVIARLFAPAEFGLYSAWLGLVMILAVFVTFRYDMSFAIEKDGEPRQVAVFATLTTAFVITSLIAVLGLLCYLIAPGVLDKYSARLALLLLPTALTIAAYEVWQSWAAAEGAYRRLSMIRIAFTGLVTCIQILMGYAYSNSASALALGHLIGAVLAIAVAAATLRVRIPSSPKEMLSFWKRQHRFPKYSLPADIVSAASQQLPVLLVAGQFGAEKAGFLALTIRVLGAPIGLLGKSVLDVFKRYAAVSFRDNGNCRAEYLRTFRILTLCSILFCIAMFAVSEPLFVIAFGPEWKQAGTIAVWLLPLFALRFIASPLSYVVYIAEKQHIDLYWQIGLLGMTLACLIAIPEFEAALVSYSLGYSMMYLIYLGMSYRLSLGDPA